MLNRIRSLLSRFYACAHALTPAPRVLLELGVDVLYADVDAVWIDNPLPDLDGTDHDLMIQADADSPNVSQRVE